MNGSRGTAETRPSVHHRWQLRVLNGPLCGTTLPVEELLTIGRDASSDLQLLAQEVSRHHARIEEHEHGGHALLDLGSSNGTYVDGELVRRHMLEPHAEITIAEFELVYEPVPRAPKAEPTPPPKVEAILRAAHTPVAAARRHAPTTPVGIAVPAGAIRDRSGHAMVFEHPESGTYVGNLFADIVEYRTLRAQQLRGGLGDPKLSSTFEGLKARLKHPASSEGRPARRGLRRFACWSSANVQLPSGATLPCYVCEVGVDGARLVVDGAQGLAVDDAVRMSIDMVEAGERRSIVLPGRVEWTDSDLVGMVFCGAPRREDGCYARQYVRPPAAAGTEEPTTLMLRPPRPRVP
jgi:hypothetical protein